MEKYIKIIQIMNSKTNCSFIMGIHWTPMNSPQKVSNVVLLILIYLFFLESVFEMPALILDKGIIHKATSMIKIDERSMITWKGSMLYVLYYMTIGFMSTLKLWEYFSNKKKHVKILKRALLLWIIAWLWIFMGNDINFSTAAGLFRLYMPVLSNRMCNEGECMSPYSPCQSLTPMIGNSSNRWCKKHYYNLQLCLQINCKCALLW